MRVPHDAQPLKSVTRMTGLSADLIRAWERRYGVVRPVRGARGARLYSNADIDHLRLLGRAVATGRSIGDVAALDSASLRALCRTEAAAPPATATATNDALLDRLLAAIARFDAPALDRELGDALLALGITEFARRVAAPLLETVGERSMDGRLTFADEHMVSATVRNLLASIMRSRSHAGGPVVLLTTPSGERHEFGLLLAALHVLESGLGVCYLGPDLPADQIVAAAERARVAVVGVGVVDGSNRTRAAAEVRRVERTLPRGVEIWIGGRDARRLRARGAPTRALGLDALAELESETRRLRALGAAATNQREH
jgi:DNA-binding transcriptional MerR regulator/methylmalonyl-CoA mutase cobalamin-binding subunit